MKYLEFFILFLATFIPSLHAREYNPPSCGIAGYIITDLSTGRIIASHNADIALVPASTLKCVTTAGALMHHSPEYRFTTKVLTQGNITNDSLTGTLIVLPGGDPELNSDLARKIANRNLKYIEGQVHIVATEPMPLPTDMVEDIGTEYGVGWSTFNYNNNEMLINDLMYPQPLSALTEEFISDLKINGIEIKTDNLVPADTVATLLLEYKSRPLKEITRDLMFKSNNLAAQSVGRSLSKDLNHSEALGILKKLLLTNGIDTCSMRMNDFSGLSRANLITPRTLNSVLTLMKNNNEYVACFPRVGRQGTVKRLLNKTPLEGKLALKSGSMTGVLAYAGYKLGNDNKPSHAIVIIVNNALCRQAEVKRSIERWLLENF